MWHFLFRPAIALMERMNSARKMMLIAGVFLLPLGYFTWQLIENLQESVASTRSEIVGQRRFNRCCPSSSTYNSTATRLAG